MSCPLATFAVSFSPLQGRLRRPPGARAPARRLRAHPQARLLAPPRPAQAHAAGRRHRARHRPRGRPRVSRRRAGGLGHERHDGPLLGPRGRRPLLHDHGGARDALDRARLRGQPHRRGRRGGDRRARQTRARPRRPLSPAQRRAALRARHRVGLHAAAHRARGRRSRREGPAAARRRHREPRLAPGRVHRPDPERDDGVADGPPALHHRPGLPLRRAQEDRGLLRPRGLLLPGDRVHPRGRAPARQRAARVSRLPRGGDARHQRPDGQHRRVQRSGGLPQPRRPQGRAAAHRQGAQQPHRARRPPERAAHGRPARLRRPRPAHRDAGGRRHPGARRTIPYKADVPALFDLIEKERPELIILGKSMVLHPEPVYEVRTFLDEAGRRRRAHVRHGARPRPRRPALPAAVRGGRRHRHRVDAQDLLRHPARHHRRPLAGAGGDATTCGRRSSAAPSPAR